MKKIIYLEILKTRVERVAEGHERPLMSAQPAILNRKFAAEGRHIKKNMYIKILKTRGRRPRRRHPLPLATPRSGGRKLAAEGRWERVAEGHERPSTPAQPASIYIK